MRIQLLTTDGHCYVQLDDWRVPFHDERQARDYLARLEQRIAAPHVLPDRASRLSPRQRRPA